MGKPSANRISLTSAGLKGFRPPENAEFVWDQDLIGFCLRTRGRDDPSAWRWMYVYRHKTTRAQPKITIGRFLDITPEEARKAVRGLAKASNGTDDQWVAVRRERLRVKVENERPTVQTIWERYRDGGGDLLKSAHGYERLWVNHLSPFFGAMKVADVTVADVERFKASKRKTPGAANRSLAVLSILFGKAILWGERKGCAPEHPVKGVQRYEERAKEFHFSEDELKAILAAADGYKTAAAARTTRARRMQRGEEYGLVIRWLIRTGARAGEVLAARWDQFVPYDADRLGRIHIQRSQSMMAARWMKARNWSVLRS